VAAACCHLLRRAGVAPPQRRAGRRTPDPLLALGISEREFQVLELLLDRLHNRRIAERLFISPRAVEKHVASLMLKTGQPNLTEDAM
jgi:DNA-binding NarL/FixJ family response regulator